MKKELYLFAFVAAAIALISTAAFFFPPLSSDAWWQFSSGRQIVNSRAMPAQDDFSCGGPRPWVKHEWLFEAALFRLYSSGGERAVKGACAGIFGLTLFAVFAAAYFASGRKAIASVLAASAAAFFLLNFAEERAQLTTFFFFSVFILITILKPKGKNLIAYYVLPLLTLLWVNLHTAPQAGLYVLAVNSVFHTLAATDKKKATFHLGAVFILCLAACAAGPMGLDSLLFFADSPGLKLLVKEWQSTLAFDSATTGYIITVIVFLLSAGLIIKESLEKHAARGKRLELLRLGLLFVPFFAAALATRKVLPLYAVIAAYLYAFLQAGNSAETDVKKGALIAVLSAILIFLGVRASFEKPMVIFPDSAVAWLNTQKDGCIFTSYEWGGFVEYKCGPRKKVYLNGRLNVDEKTARRYSYIYYAEKGFGQIVNSTGADYFLLPFYSPLAKELSESGNRAVYSDELCAVYVPPLKIETDKKLDTK